MWIVNQNILILILEITGKLDVNSKLKYYNNNIVNIR